MVSLNIVVCVHIRMDTMCFVIDEWIVLRLIIIGVIREGHTGSRMVQWSYECLFIHNN